MNYIPEIYISYAWEKQEDGSSWPPILSNLYVILKEKGFKVHIDIKSLKYKDSIKSFMHELGMGKYIICIISEKYMKSINCMYEVLQMFKYPNFQDRIFPIIASDAKIYDSEKILEYLLFWDKKISNLNNEAKLLSNIAYAAPIFEDIEIMNEIRRALAQFGNEIGNMNVLTPEMHNNSNFTELIEALENKVEIDKNTINLQIENLELKKENLELRNELDKIRQNFDIKSFLKSTENIKPEIEIIENKLIEPEAVMSTINFQNDINIFMEFGGLSKKSYIKKAYEILGKPSEIIAEKKYTFNTAYFEDYADISFSRETNKIQTIRFSCHTSNSQEIIELLKRKGILDSKIELLGKHRDEILNIFGTPLSTDSDNYVYENENMLLDFICYEFNDFICTEIYVHYKQ